MKPSNRPSRFAATALCATLLVGTAAVSASAAPAPAMSAPASVQVVQGPMVVPAVTSSASTYKSCNTFNTSSLWFKNDVMSVTRWKSTNGYWYYSVARTSNRYTYQTTSQSVYPWYHQARDFFVYWSSSSYSTFDYPGNTLTVRSSSPYVDFKLYMNLTASYIYKSTGQCYIYF